MHFPWPPWGSHGGCRGSHDPRPRTAALILPADPGPLLAAVAPVLARPTYARFLPLLGVAVPTTGRPTAATGPRTAGHRATYRRALSSARWPGLAPGRAPARFLPDHVLTGGVARLVGDDPVGGHAGEHVSGEARHRAPGRSTRPSAAWRYGHRRVVPAVLVRLPLTPRPWARPVLIDLDRPPDRDRTHRDEYLLTTDRRSPRPTSSRGTRGGGTSRPPFRTVGRASGWRPRGGGAGAPSCVRPRAGSGWTRSSPSGSTPCRPAGGWAWGPGPGRTWPRSRTPSPPPAGGCGPTGLSHGPGPTSRSNYSFPASENSLFDALAPAA